MIHVGSSDTNPPDYQNVFRFDIGKEYWYGMSIWLAGDWVDDVKSCGDLIWQFQASPDDGEPYRSPVLALYIDQDHYDLRAR